VCLCHNPPFWHSRQGFPLLSPSLPSARGCNAPNMRRLTCPAIAMIVESDVLFSASWVMAPCRRSWKRNPGCDAECPTLR